MTEARTTFRAIVFGIAGIIIALLVFRIGLDIIDANPANAFVSLINDLTNRLIDPFRGIIDISDLGLDPLNVDAIIAIGIYILGAIAFTEIVTAFMYDSASDIFINFVDGVFKVVEFLIFLRIVFSFFGIFKTSTSPTFVNVVYDLTGWTQIVNFRPSFLEGVLDVPAIIVLVIVVILDLLTESFLAGIFDDIDRGVTKIRRRVVVRRDNPPPAQKVVALQPPSQNITINVPAPTQPVVVQPGPPRVIVNPPNQEA